MLDPGTSSDMEREVVNKITGSFQSGKKILQITSLNDICGSELGEPVRTVRGGRNLGMWRRRRLTLRCRVLFGLSPH